MAHLKWIVISCIISCLCLNVISEDENTESTGGRIVGGFPVEKREQFAYQATLRIAVNGAIICGATVIEKRHVLTATHCCFNNDKKLKPSQLLVVTGDIDHSSTNTLRQRKSVTHMFLHPLYNSKTIENDIAVLRISGTFEPWSSYVKPVEIASYIPPPGTFCFVSGWGKLDEDHNQISRRLYAALVPILPQDHCEASYLGAIQRGMFCAGFMDGTIDACQGDSGGPLVCDNVLVGVVSWGIGCARPGQPGVYADVSMYKPWISQQFNRSGARSVTIYHSLASQLVFVLVILDISRYVI